MERLTPRELLALREFLRVLRQLEAGGLAHHAEITIVLRGRSVAVEARVLAGGATVPTSESEHE